MYTNCITYSIASTKRDAIIITKCTTINKSYANTIHGTEFITNYFDHAVSCSNVITINLSIGKSIIRTIVITISSSYIITNGIG